MKAIMESEISYGDMILHHRLLSYSNQTIH